MKHIISKLTKLTAASIIVMALASCGGKEDRKASYLEKGKAYLEEKNYDKARIEFKNVLQIDPKFADAYFYMGRLEEKNKEYIKAVGNYKKAIELNPNHVSAKVKLAAIFIMAGAENYIGEAKELLNEIMAIEPEHSEALFLLNSIEYKEGDADKAVSQMEKIVSKDIHLIGGIALLSNIYSSNDRKAEAIQLLKKGVVNNPEEIYLRVNLSEILLETKDLAGAEKYLREAISIDPEMYSLQFSLSKFYVNTGQLDKAKEVLIKSIEQSPDDAKRYLVLVQLLASKFSVEKAETELQKMIADRPDISELKFALVHFYKKIAKREKAKIILAQIIDNNKYDVNGIKARNILAKILLDEGDLGGAKVQVNEVLAEHPNENDALIIFSKLALNDKDAITAINGLRTVVKNNPKNPEASLLLAQAYELNKEPGLAEAELKRSVEANPANDAVHINFARYLASKGRVDEAAVIVDRALTYFKDSFGLMEMKLKIIASQGNESEVISLLNKMEQTDESKADVNIFRGQYYLLKKDINKALEQFEKAYEKSSNKYEALELITKAHLLNKKPEDALERLKILYGEEAENAIAHHLSAKVYLSQKKLADARDQFKLASKASVQWTLPYLGLATTYIAENNLKQAENIYQDALNNVTDKTQMYMQLAALYERQKLYDKAISMYKQLLDIKPDDMIAKNNYASLLLDHGGDDGVAKALTLLDGFEKAQQPAFQDTLAWAYAKSDNYVKAVELLKPLVEKAPEVAVFRYHLGYALYHMGDKAAAKSHLTIADSSKQQFVGKEQVKALLESI